jgi:WD40 repeat protein
VTLPQLAGITNLHRADVRDVLESIAQFLRMEGKEAQISVYHDSFRDFLLTTEVEPSRAHEAMVGYFTAASAGDWFSADRYAYEHLATHASACGRLAELIESPAFLAVAEPRTLVPALNGLATANARVYLAAAWLLGDEPVTARVNHLELAARSMRADELARSLSDLPVDRSWKPLWSRSVVKRPSRTLGQIPDGVLAMILIDVDGRPTLAALGGGGGIWLLELDSANDPILLTEFGWTSGLAGGVVDGRPVLLAADSERLALVEISSKTITEIPAGDSLVTALALTNGPEGLLAITGHEDGRIQLVNLVSMDVVAHWQGHSSLVTSLDVEDHADELWVVSAGADGKATIWCLGQDETSNSVIPLYQEDTAWVGAVSLIRGGTDTMVLGGTSEGLVFFASDPSTKSVGNLWQAHEPAGANDLFYMKEGEQKLTRTVTRQKVGFADIVEPGSRPVAIRGGVNGVAGLWSDGGPIVVTSGQDGKVILSWPKAGTGDLDLLELATSSEPVGPIVLRSIEASTVVLYAEMGPHGAVVETELFGADGLVPSKTGELPGTVAAIAAGEAPLVAALLSSGHIMVWDPNSGDLLGAPYRDKNLQIGGIAVASSGRKPVLAVVGLLLRKPAVMLMERPGAGPAAKLDLITSLGPVYAVAVTDAEMGTLLVGGTSREGGPGLTKLLPKKRSPWRILGTHWREQPIPFPKDVDPFVITMLRSLTIGPHTHVIACGDNYTIWIAPRTDGESATLAYNFHWTADPVLARWHGRPTLLVGSWDRLSTRRIDDPLGDQPIIDLTHKPMPRVITAVAALDVERLLVVGDSYGTITLWRDGATTASEIIHIGAAVRHLALYDDRTLLVSTTESTFALRIAISQLDNDRS